MPQADSPAPATADGLQSRDVLFLADAVVAVPVLLTDLARTSMKVLGSRDRVEQRVAAEFDVVEVVPDVGVFVAAGPIRWLIRRARTSAECCVDRQNR